MAFDECPNGHKLPHYTKQGQCTPIYCVAPQMNPGNRKPENPGSTMMKAREEHLEREEGALREEVEAQNKLVKRVNDERRHLEYKRRVLELRRELLETPQGLEGEQAEQWADRQLVKLLPEAISVLDYNLKYGDSAEQERAANKVLDATGRGKREQSPAAVAPIIMLVNPGGGPIQAPWLRKVSTRDEKEKDVVEATALPAGVP